MNGWTVHSEQWQILIKLITPQFVWHRVNFLPLYQDTVPTTPGIYAICVKPRNVLPGLFPKLYNVLYVGKTTSLRTRFLTHCNRPELVVQQAFQCFDSPFCFWYMEVSDENERGLMESVLIDCLGPTANKIRGSIPGEILNPVPA